MIIRILASIIKTGFTTLHQTLIISPTESQNYLHQTMLQNFINVDKLFKLAIKNISNTFKSDKKIKLASTKIAKQSNITINLLLRGCYSKY